MAFTYSESEGYIKASESIVIAANNSGSAVKTSGSAQAINGQGMVFAKADEETGCTAVLEYTLDSSAISIGGIGADPSTRDLGSQTWIEAKATDDDAASGAMGDDKLEAFLIPKKAKFVRITYSAANEYAGSTEATEIWMDDVNSGIGMTISGIGADPS